MNEFKKFTRTQFSEMREINEIDLTAFNLMGFIGCSPDTVISISDTDSQNGSPRIGDMVARNPKNHNDQWLVAEQYFKDNFCHSNQAE